LQDFKASLNLQRKTANAATVSPCANGGTRTDDPGTTAGNFKVTYVDCNESGTVLNGSISSTATTNGFTFTFDKFTSKATDNSEEEDFDGTMTLTGTEETCDTGSGTKAAANKVETFLKNAVFTLNFTGTTKTDTNKDGTFEVNETVVFSNFAMTINEDHTKAPDCTPGVTTFGLSGGASLTDQVNTTDSFIATFTNFTMTFTPTTKTINGVSKDGDSVSISGTIVIQSSCANGTFTLSTPAGHEPFFPTDASCPVDGEIIVSSGGTDTTVTFTATGGVQVGDKTFANCEDADTCAS